MKVTCRTCGFDLKVVNGKVEICSKCLEFFQKEAYDEGYFKGKEVAEGDAEDYNMGWRK